MHVEEPAEGGEDNVFTGLVFQDLTKEQLDRIWATNDHEERVR